MADRDVALALEAAKAAEVDELLLMQWTANRNAHVVEDQVCAKTIFERIAKF